ncbi:hypothetical protein J2W14_003024 [Pseudarthrobacter oxydans]|nr:hypothetical protein [Pseudarthrobacter oxydans]
MKSEPYDSHGGPVELPLSSRAFEELLDVCPFLEVDDRSATLHSFGSRLKQFWLPDEPILYIGKAGTSLSARTRAHYSTKIGATGPHAGGWWLKMLTALPELTVHYARHSNPGAAEDALIDQFARQLSHASRSNLLDGNRVGPFANVRIPGLGRIRSYLRIPARSKYAFPAIPTTLTMFVRGEKRAASWHPGNGRLGRLGLSTALMAELVVPGMPVHIEALNIATASSTRRNDNNRLRLTIPSEFLTASRAQLSLSGRPLQFIMTTESTRFCRPAPSEQPRNRARRS